MKIKYDESLAVYTSFKMGGIAKELLIPESVEDLMSISNLSVEFWIGGGSNMLITQRNFDRVLYLGEVDNSICALGDGQYKVGASVRLQRLITRINEDRRGGIEYLISVPGLVGGAIVMNAGRGKEYNASISDYIVSVDALVDGSIKTFVREKCDFSYRCSIFQKMGAIVLSAIFRFPDMDIEVSRKNKEDRLNLCRKSQDNSYPNFGSVFKLCNPRVMTLVRIGGIRYKGIAFSKKTGNWLLNKGGSYNDAIRLIRFVELIHKVLKSECEREVIVIE